MNFSKAPDKDFKTSSRQEKASGEIRKALNDAYLGI